MIQVRENKKQITNQHLPDELEIGKNISIYTTDASFVGVIDKIEKFSKKIIIFVRLTKGRCNRIHKIILEERKKGCVYMTPIS